MGPSISYVCTSGGGLCVKPIVYILCVLHTKKKGGGVKLACENAYTIIGNYRKKGGKSLFFSQTARGFQNMIYHLSSHN